MKTLSESILMSHHERKRAIAELKREAGTVREDARKFFESCEKMHQEMAKNLKENLVKGREGITEEVRTLRRRFQKEQIDVRKDLNNASKTWKEMGRILRDRRRETVLFKTLERE